MKSMTARLVPCLTLALVLLAGASKASGQVLIASNGFEGADNWTIAAQAGSITNIVGGGGDSPANGRIRNGTYSWQSSNGSNTLDFTSVGLSGSTGCEIVVHLASISGSSGNGSDGGDRFGVYVAVNGSAFATNADIRVAGNSNARWGYGATNFLRTTAGSILTNAAPQAGLSNNNFSVLMVDLPNSATSVAVRLISGNNDTNEYWCVDDVQLYRDVQIVSGPATNQPPVLAAIGNRTVLTNLTLSFDVTASDLTDNDTITLSASGLPAGATFATTSAASQVTNAFVWLSPSPVGVYTTTFYAVDNDGTNLETITISVTSTPFSVTNRPPVWINELHYDNVGANVGGGYEIAGPGDAALTNFYVLLYNGANGTVYGSNALSGSIPAESCGYGAKWFPDSGLQIGSPDGLALVQKSPPDVLQFLSYEGTFVAANGAAAGILSLEMGTNENPDNTVAIGNSLQLQGSGTNYFDFTWAGPTNVNSTGLLNTAIGQVISPCSTGFPPTLASIGAKFVVSSGTLSFVVSADDLTDGNDISLYASNLPSGATFTTTNHGTNVSSTFNWVGANPAGVYTTTFYATDNNGTDFEDVLISVTSSPVFVVGEPVVWINELHYDNTNTDAGEGFEIAGPTGTDLTAFYVLRYGSNGNFIASNALAGSIDAESCNLGAVNFANAGLPNTGPVGLAIVQNPATVIQFISYEGTVTATNGAAAGLTSTDIGVNENPDNNVPVGYSLQLQGVGTSYSQFTWAGPTNLATPDVINAPIQTNSPCGNDDDGDLLPNSWETFYFGSATGATATADSDSDGFDNLSEYIAGTHPTNGASYFNLDAFSNSAGRVIYFDTVTGRVYGLDVSSNLLDGAGWVNITNYVPGNGGFLIITDGVSDAQRHYRGDVKLP